MKVLLSLVFVAVSSAVLLKYKAAVTPTVKVIEMLKACLSQGEKEKKEEELAFAAYKQWCIDTSATKDAAIKEATTLMETLEAQIGKFEAHAKRLAKEIQQHDADIATWDADHKDATEIREHENTDFVATHKDYSESIDALERAIKVLKEQSFNRAQAASLLQTLRTKLPAAARTDIDAFLQSAQEPPAATGLGYKAPEAHAYEFQSGGVTDMLEKLLDKFIDERTQLEKEEANARHAYEMLSQDLQNSIATATKSRDQKTEVRGRKLRNAGDRKGELADTTQTYEGDKKYLTDLKAQCETKNQEFESRQKLRGEEIEAVTQAIDVLESTVKPHAEKYLPTLVQTPTLIQKNRGHAHAVKATSFIQVGSKSRRAVQTTVAEFLRTRAEKLNSSVLLSLSAKVADDPFTKVKKMIQDLIVRLMEEANAEAEHKGWCDTELKANEQTRKSKSDEVDTLASEVEELTANINKLAQEVADTTSELSELEAAMAKASEHRQKEKETNKQTIADAQEAQTAVAQALTILKEFYAKAGEATAFLQLKSALYQTPEADAPMTWDESFKGGGQGGKGGVVAMLEVIQSDFARLETETKADEEQASKDYLSFMMESQVNKATMEKDIEDKTEKKHTLEGDKQEKIQDHEGAQKELDAALAYYEKLKPACVDTSVSYEDRVARRKEEIESLQEALKILNGEDLAAAFIQKASKVRRH
ncbi:unnamed protein product [Vitrella brassicaformis CCMP3155]|uniref:Uncharacterized protein n=1 Tax=Vitrella brassicaformis (strain CCMP3155) TaxID=1169540 RepID=A0A0G4H1B8_VITBC|nr:unnamed protein product [Vitrella brassicaformis CCMP3155]|eukprot:CEM37375.1 unnamed protein product [Vitrella brassicaformis CCMP3155]